MSLDPHQVGALAIAADEALQGALSCLPEPQTNESTTMVALRSCLRSAKATVAVLALSAEAAMEPPEEEDDDGPGATQDPATCSHPRTFPPPADDLCRSCGATRQLDGTWSA